MLLRFAYLAVTDAFAAVRLLPMSDREKDAEILVLRHQIAVLHRQLGDHELMSGGLVPVASGMDKHDGASAIRIKNRYAALHAARLQPGQRVELPDQPSGTVSHLSGVVGEYESGQPFAGLCGSVLVVGRGLTHEGHSPVSACSADTEYSRSAPPCGPPSHTGLARAGTCPASAPPGTGSPEHVRFPERLVGGDGDAVLLLPLREHLEEQFDAATGMVPYRAWCQRATAVTRPKTAAARTERWGPVRAGGGAHPAVAAFTTALHSAVPADLAHSV